MAVSPYASNANIGGKRGGTCTTEMETKSTTKNMVAATERIKACEDAAERPQPVVKAV